MDAAAATTSVEPRERAAEYRRALAQARAELRAEYLARPVARLLLRRHSALVDGALRSAWSSLAMPTKAALLAVGGYGRRELFPHSDVDVLVLLPDDTDEELRERVGRLVSTLWDLGLEVGHSVRTVAECVSEAGQDISVETTLIEARSVAGSRTLHARLTEAMDARADPRAFLEAKLLEQAQRHSRFNDTAYNLEPNIKESPGGLRDLTNILWISQGASMGSRFAELATGGIITTDEARQMLRLQRSLQELRIHLHYLAGRREDRLVFDLQTPMALTLGFVERPGQRASEQMMQRYYRTARAVTQLNEIILQNLRARIAPPPYSVARRLGPRFQVRNELLEADDERLYEEDPTAVLETFALLQRHPEVKGIGAATLRSLWRSAHRIDGAFRRDPRNRAAFVEMFRHGRGLTHALRRMNRYDVLGRYLPTFGRIVGQMQHDLFHVYTVDEHILMVLRNLRRFAVTEMSHEYPLCTRLMSEFRKPELLYLAGLFHDIAKGRGGDHSSLGGQEAHRFCRTHGIAHADAHLVAWLVENHLVMSGVAQKQDLSDPEVISAFARLVGNETSLTALYLLTVADVRGTSPKVWNAWKAKLLEDLYWATRRFLGGERDPNHRRQQRRQELALAKLRLYALPEGAQEVLWSRLDSTYFLRHDVREIAWHARVLYARSDTSGPILKARLSPVGEGVQVMVYAPEEKHIFARICGFFERIGFSIAEAKVYTTLHGYVLDTFQVLDPNRAGSHYRDVIAFIEQEMREELARVDALPPPVRGRVSRRVRSFPVTPEVNIRPDERGNAYYLSFTAGDRPGLLYGVALVLVHYGVNVRTARINTLGERAEDSFVVTGEALGNTRTVIRLESDLIRALET